MHATCYRNRMTEESFQILFDVMERHFAALSLPDPSSDPKITRAISFTELPSSRRILIEQCYQTDDSGNLVRQYSCEQIFDKSSNTREVKVSEVVRSGSEHCLKNTWKTTLPVFGVGRNADWHTGKFDRTVKSVIPTSRREMESMEIEEIDERLFKRPFAIKKSENPPIIELNGMSLSELPAEEKPLIRASTFGMLSSGTGISAKKPAIRSRSVSPKKSADRPISSACKVVENLENHEKNPPKSDYNDIKKKLRSLIPEESKKSRESRFSGSWYKILFFILLSLSAASLAIFLQGVDRARNDLRLDFANVSLELRENVYGQENAIEELISDLRKSSAGINLVALVGGTGVGKSYAVGIVKRHFPHGDHVFEYFSPLRKSLHEVFQSISYRHCNLIVLENLREDDLRDVVRFVEFMKTHTNKTCVYAIAVFNPQETDESLERKLNLEENVGKIGAFFWKHDIRDARVIGFRSLDERSVEKCVRKAAEEKNVRILDSQLEEIRKTLVFANSGCKGAHAKIQLLENL